MLYSEIQDGEVFYINGVKEYPKMKVGQGHVDLRDNVRASSGSDEWEVELAPTCDVCGAICTEEQIYMTDPSVGSCEALCDLHKPAQPETEICPVCSNGFLAGGTAKFCSTDCEAVAATQAVKTNDGPNGKG